MSVHRYDCLLHWKEQKLIYLSSPMSDLTCTASVLYTRKMVETFDQRHLDCRSIPAAEGLRFDALPIPVPMLGGALVSGLTSLPILRQTILNVTRSLDLSSLRHYSSTLQAPGPYFFWRTSPETCLYNLHPLIVSWRRITKYLLA
jgi:hypothetical protein